MKKIIILFVIVLLASCRGKEANKNNSSSMQENASSFSIHENEFSSSKREEESSIIQIPLEIKDSLFIGCPQIADKNFLRAIYGGIYTGREDKYFFDFEKILNHFNKLYINCVPNKPIKELQLEDITLKLVRKPYKNKKDIEIMLEIYKDKEKTDEILFYRNINDIMEQHQIYLSYIDGGIIWALEGFTNQEELVIVHEYYKKYEINKHTGKIVFLEEINTSEIN